MAGSTPSTILDPIARISAYGPWLIVSVALRLALTYPWDAASWGEEEKVVVVNAAYLEQHVPFIRDGLKRAGIRLAHLLDTSLGQ